MSYEYDGETYETLEEAQAAAIDDYLTASGTWEVADALQPGVTPELIAADIILDDWHIPGISYWEDDRMKRVTELVRRRLRAHGVDL